MAGLLWGDYRFYAFLREEQHRLAQTVQMRDTSIGRSRISSIGPIEKGSGPLGDWRCHARRDKRAHLGTEPISTPLGGRMRGFQTHLNHILRIGEDELAEVALDLPHWPTRRSFSLGLSGSGNTGALSWAE